jgi:lipopolysaccharide transport system ATP-binding protein
MSSEIAIQVKDLGKCYHIYDRPRDRLLQMLVSGRHKYYREFWALRKVSLDVRRGETVGIVGRNGSGKSTLLQLICGTTDQTEGEVWVPGRIAPLLELGTGFNPDFTGRENVFLNAALLGASREETRSRYDDIVTFADIGDFLEQPVKTYSSGMVIRLAFAVAVSVKPDVLVIDEALAVGDELFQRKCYSRIAALKNSGTTILFVTHSANAIVELCDRAVLLDGGQLLCDGAPKRIVGAYQRLLYARPERRDEIRNDIARGEEHGLPATVSLSNAIANDQLRSLSAGVSDEGFDPGLSSQSAISYESRGVRILNPRILNDEGVQVNKLQRGATYKYVYDVGFDKTCAGVRFGMLIKAVSGTELGGAVSAPGTFAAIPVVDAGTHYRIEFQFKCALGSGVYFLNAGVVGIEEEQEIFLHRLLDACVFRVAPERDATMTGSVDFSCVASISRTKAPDQRESQRAVR